MYKSPEEKVLDYLMKVENKLDFIPDNKFYFRIFKMLYYPIKLLLLIIISIGSLYALPFIWIFKYIAYGEY